MTEQSRFIYVSDTENLKKLYRTLTNWNVEGAERVIRLIVHHRNRLREGSVLKLISFKFSDGHTEYSVYWKPEYHIDKCCAVYHSEPQKGAGMLKALIKAILAGWR